MRPMSCRARRQRRLLLARHKFRARLARLRRQSLQPTEAMIAVRRAEVIAAFQNATGVNEITIKTIDPVRLHMVALDGTRYAEADDHAIVCVDGNDPLPVRYYTTASHGGGLTLKPRSVFIDGAWHSAIDGSVEHDISDLPPGFANRTACLYALPSHAEADGPTIRSGEHNMNRKDDIRPHR